MTKSIYGKLFIGFVLTIVISYVITGFFAVHQSHSDTKRIAVKDLQHSSSHIVDLVEQIDSSKRDKILKNYGEDSDLRFMIISEDYHFKTSNISRDVRFTDKEIASLKANVGKSIVHNAGTKTAYAKSYQINNTVYVVTIQKDSKTVQKVYLMSYTLSGIILFIAGSLVFLFVSDLIVRPISTLTKATNELSKGNYKVRVNYAGNDEIAQLYNSFNQMAVQLDKQEETRQQFISDVSHEFQTPLTAISGFANILKTENLPDDQRQKYAEIILSNANRLSKLSKNMLQLSLLEGEDIQLDMAPFNLIMQLNRVIETQDYSALSKDIEIEFIKPRGDIMINADEARMEQVWTNLINNAIKYTNEHGVITVEVKKSGGDVIVSVSDTGIGMSQETISHIFERFYRDDKSRAIEGNGLGLSIVARIIALHKFKIDVTSQLDVGTTFTVRMPMYSKRQRARFNTNGGKEE